MDSKAKCKERKYITINTFFLTFSLKERNALLKNIKNPDSKKVKIKDYLQQKYKKWDTMRKYFQMHYAIIQERRTPINYFFNVYF